MLRRLFTLASAVSLTALFGCGAPTPGASRPVPPQTQDMSDVSVVLKDLGPTDASILGPGELCRMSGSGMEVICLADDSAFLRLSPEIRLPLASPEQVRYRNRALEGLLGGDLANPPASPQEEASDRVLRSVIETKMLSTPLACIPDRLAQALGSPGRRREQFVALARTTLRDQPIRLTGQSRSADGLKAWQLELRLTPHGRAKLQAALSAALAGRLAPPTQGSDRPTTPE